MVFDYKIKKIYDSSSNIYFKTKELNELGMNSKDIKKMVTEGYIKRLYRGFYELEFQKTYSLSNKYDRQKNYELSIKCLLKCYLLDPTNQKILYKLYNKYKFEGDLLSACYYFLILLIQKTLFLNKNSK